jgi:hypothetical protein
MRDINKTNILLVVWVSAFSCTLQSEIARCTSPFFNSQIIFYIDSLTIVASDKMFNISESLRTGWPPLEYLEHRAKQP